MPEQTNILDAIRTVVQEENRPMEKRLEKKITEFKDETLNHVDAVMKEVVTTREEQAAIGHRVDNHEERITTLEGGMNTAKSTV
jgi:BMFP domain-containing protein YqiC|tara:strand:+ start:947 stop:1198 length:252 start_codon:yes stop_codon:yes gene_type:complete